MKQLSTTFCPHRTLILELRNEAHSIQLMYLYHLAIRMYHPFFEPLWHRSHTKLKRGFRVAPMACLSGRAWDLRVVLRCCLSSAKKGSTQVIGIFIFFSLDILFVVSRVLSKPQSRGSLVGVEATIKLSLILEPHGKFSWCDKSPSVSGIIDIKKQYRTAGQKWTLFIGQWLQLTLS